MLGLLQMVNTYTTTHMHVHLDSPLICATSAVTAAAAAVVQGCEIGQQSFCLMSPTQRPYELGEGGKTGNLLTMFLTGPLMAFCLASGNTDPSIQQLVDLQVGI